MSLGTERMGGWSAYPASQTWGADRPSAKPSSYPHTLPPPSSRGGSLHPSTTSGKSRRSGRSGPWSGGPRFSGPQGLGKYNPRKSGTWRSPTLTANSFQGIVTRADHSLSLPTGKAPRSYRCSLGMAIVSCFTGLWCLSVPALVLTSGALRGYTADSKEARRACLRGAAFWITAVTITLAAGFAAIMWYYVAPDILNDRNPEA